MIEQMQTNVAAFAGNMRTIWIGQPFMSEQISVTTAAAPTAAGIFDIYYKTLLQGVGR